MLRVTARGVMRESTLPRLRGLRSRASVSGARPEPGLWPAGVRCPTERSRGLAKAAGERGGNGARGAMLTPVWEEGCSKYMLFTQGTRCSSPPCGGESRTGENGRDRKERRGHRETGGTEARRGLGILPGLEKRILPNTGGLGTTCRRLRPSEGGPRPHPTPQPTGACVHHHPACFYG